MGRHLMNVNWPIAIMLLVLALNCALLGSFAIGAIAAVAGGAMVYRALTTTPRAEEPLQRP